jgi:hypothetical protein
MTPVRSMTPGAPTRTMTPNPNLVAPQPQRAWNGASQSPMSPSITSYGSARGSPMSPNFPPPSPQGQPYGGGYGGSRGGYQRF